MQAGDYLIHHPGREKHLLDLLSLGDSAQLVTKGNGDLGFEQPFFCSALVGVCRGAMIISTLMVSKLIESVKYCDIDFVTDFVTPDPA